MVSYDLLVNFIFQNLQKDKSSGQGLIEYALIFVLVVVVVIAALRLFGTQLDVTYNNIVDNLGNLPN